MVTMLQELRTRYDYVSLTWIIDDGVWACSACDSELPSLYDTKGTPEKVVESVYNAYRRFV